MKRLPTSARVLAVAGAALVALVMGIYGAVMRDQGNTPAAGWLVAMGVPGVLALVAAISPARPAVWLLVGATAVLCVIGLLAIFTIGLGFWLAAVATGAAALVGVAGAARPRPRHRGSSSRR